MTVSEHVTRYGQCLLELGAAHDLIIYNGLQRWPMSRGLTYFPHGRGTSTVDYLIGPLAFLSQGPSFLVPSPPLGADHSYLAFHISSTIPISCAAPILPGVHVHFDHVLDHVYESHLTQGIDLPEEIELSLATNALTSVIHDVATHSFPTKPVSLDMSNQDLCPRTLGMMTSVEL